MPTCFGPSLRPSPDDTLAFHRQFFTGTNGASPLAVALDHNFGTYLPYDLLVKTDRMSMAHALETRTPFLDTALIEYVAPLPDRYKLRGWPRPTTKYILRRAFKDLLPPSILSRGKMGFGLPLGTWFRQDLRPYIEERILAPDARINELLRPEVVRTVFDEHLAGRADHEHQLWLLLTMELWLRNLERLTLPWSESTGQAIAGFRPETSPTTTSVLGRPGWWGRRFHDTRTGGSEDFDHALFDNRRCGFHRLSPGRRAAQAGPRGLRGRRLVDR